MSKTKSQFSLSAVITQLSRIWKTILIGVLLSLGGAGFTVLVATLTGKPIWMLATDPAEVQYFPPYIGMLSNWGVILWIATASICLFSAILLKRQKASKPAFKFLATSGVFSLLLGIDDLYMLHDRVLPRMFHMHEIFFYLLYFFVFAAYLAYFATQILKYDYLLFTAAFLFFVTSRQFFTRFSYFGIFSTGDMLKYFGIVFWLIFFYRTALYEAGGLLRNEKSA